MFATFAPQMLDRIPATGAGWYAGRSIWDSCYGPTMELADDARRFDVSPAWLSWVGTVPSLQLFTALPREVTRWHGALLADALRARLDLPAAGRPVLSLPDPHRRSARALADAGCTVAGRAGMVRIAFHLWNTEDDVERAAGALLG